MVFLLKKGTGEIVGFFSDEGAAKTLAAFPEKYQEYEFDKPVEKKEKKKEKKAKDEPEKVEEEVILSDPEEIV